MGTSTDQVTPKTGSFNLAVWRYLMPAFSTNLTIETPLSPEDALDRITCLLRRSPLCASLSLDPTVVAKLCYEGTVTQRGFTLRPTVAIRDGGYRMTARGRVEPHGTGATVYLSFQARFWCVLLIAICAFQVLLLSAARADAPWLVSGLWGLYHLIGCLIYSYQVRRAHGDLKSLLCT